MIAYGLEWHTLDTYFSFSELGTEPETPEDGMVRLFAEDDGAGVSTLCYKNDAGTKICFPTSGSFVTGAGSAGAVAFWTGTNTIGEDPTKFFWNATDNKLFIGAATAHLGTDAPLEVHNEGANTIISSSTHSDTAGHSGALTALRSRGTHAAPTIVAANDKILRLIAQGYDGSAYRDMAAIDANVDATPGASDMPGRLSFWTTPDGSTTLNERWRINRSGFLGSNAIDPVTAIDVRGTGNPATQISIERDNGQANFIGYRVRGGGVATQSGDLLSLFAGGGSHTGATADRAISGIYEVLADENWTSTSKASRLGLFTVASGSTTNTERFRIGSVGQLGIGGATYGSSGDIFSSGGASAPPTWVTRATLNAALDHGTLAGLTDDDHTGYVRGAGRSGGQTVIGGTDSGDDLTLQSTSNATRGDLITDVADITMVAASRIRMASQNRFRFLNTTAKVFRAAATGNKTISNNTATVVDFDDESYDTDTIHDNATNNSRLTAQLTGKYLIFGLGQWVANATGKRQTLFAINGSDLFSEVRAAVTGGSDGTDVV